MSAARLVLAAYLLCAGFLSAFWLYAAIRYLRAVAIGQQKARR